ncbi:hypothetical protein [uncultured Helicobacter sp.]|uniref:hypothetical protein n=1 Tax=uncultured Helicobacter sp. TaxID=175537 RepID=UPI002597AE21|nr:hypothetical protein [uncultured Helicobacter sp.]
MGFFKCHIACALAFLVAMSYVLQAQDMQKDKQEVQDFTEQKYQANQNGYTDNFDVFIQFVWVRHLLDTGYQSASNPWEDAIISAKKIKYQFICTFTRKFARFSLIRFIAIFSYGFNGFTCQLASIHHYTNVRCC